jgi:propionate CoA-transferase
VFRLHPQGLALVEVAPGLDLQRDILDGMGFTPVIEAPPAEMDAAIFRDEPMGLRARLLLLPLDDRFHYDSLQRTLFINFEHLTVRTRDDIATVQAAIERQLEPMTEKVYAVVNYDHFTLAPELQDDWAAMVRALVQRHYLKVTRYSTSGFLRAKLGPALAARGVAPHIFESVEEARAALRDE